MAKKNIIDVLSDGKRHEMFCSGGRSKDENGFYQTVNCRKCKGTYKIRSEEWLDEKGYELSKKAKSDLLNDTMSCKLCGERQTLGYWMAIIGSLCGFESKTKGENALCNFYLENLEKLKRTECTNRLFETYPEELERLNYDKDYFEKYYDGMSRLEVGHIYRLCRMQKEIDNLREELRNGNTSKKKS